MRDDIVHQITKKIIDVLLETNPRVSSVKLYELIFSNIKDIMLRSLKVSEEKITKDLKEKYEFQIRNDCAKIARRAFNAGLNEYEVEAVVRTGKAFAEGLNVISKEQVDYPYEFLHSLVEKILRLMDSPLMKSAYQPDKEILLIRSIVPYLDSLAEKKV